MKTLIILNICLIGFFLKPTCSFLINRNVCTDVYPVKNFDAQKITGDWFLIAASIGETIPSTTCIIINHALKDNFTLSLTEKSLNANNVPLIKEYTQALDAVNPGFFVPEEVYFTVYDFFNQPSSQKVRGTGVFLNTDYNSVAIKYVQYQVNHFWYSECYRSAYVLVRNRILNKFSDVFTTFDSLKAVSFSLNHLEVKRNELSCGNK